MATTESVPASFGSTRLQCSTGQDQFLMNVNSAGDVLWATDQSRGKRSFFHRRATDSAGNVYETGRSGSSAIVTKHSGEGDLQWTRQWFGTGDENGDAITVDSADNIFVLGHFSDNIDVGATRLTSAGTCAAFINKLNGAGDIIWSVAVESLSNGKVAGYGIAVDDSSNVFVTGAFEGSLIHGPNTLRSNGEQDIFVLKLDMNGNIMWAISAGGAGQDSGNSIALNHNGDVYVTGSFSGTASFGNTMLSSDGDLDVFWMKLGSR